MLFSRTNVSVTQLSEIRGFSHRDKLISTKLLSDIEI